MTKRQLNNLIYLVLLVVVASLGATVFKPPELNERGPYVNIIQSEWYPVERVIDGDTIVIKILGKDTIVRLIGLDTPEVADPRQPIQCFGKEASEYMKSLLSDRSVQLEMDPTQGTYDKYGRLLAYVYTVEEASSKRIFVNRHVIKEGYGHEYTYNIPYRYQAEFQTAEREAKSANMGLWSPAACAEGGFDQ